MNNHLRQRRMLFTLLAALAAAPAPAAIRNLPGFNTTVYGANDDGTFPCTGLDPGTPTNCTPTTVPVGFPLNFYGSTFTDLYLNNNGNVTFDSSLSIFTPFGLVATARQIIAPFFADVDTRAANQVTFGNDVVDGHLAFGVNWVNVGYFDERTDKLNSFQLILIQRADRNPGDFDIEFNYDQVQWETGDASDGVDGLGGSSAVVGFSNGSGLPGTSFQLHGSGIPGQFLDTNPGGLVYRSLNTTVPGRYLIPIINLTNTVLNVLRFSQGDPRWAANTYGTSTYTIQQKGCALSSLAMALKYQGIATDPAALNTLMKNNNDFIGTSVNWSAATRDASGDTLEFHAYRTSDTAYLNQALAAGHPVIVGVNLNEEGAPGHFVVVIGKQNGQYLINDPGHANRTTLADYDNEFETRGYVADPTGDVSGLSIAMDNPATIFVVDPLGRRTGQVAGVALEEIPQAFYFLDALEDSDLTGAPGTDTAHLVDIFQPMQGIYRLLIMGTHAGSYKLSLRSFSQTGAPGTPLTFQGATTPGALTTLQVSLGPTGLTTQPFTNLCPWSASPTNGPLPLAVLFTAPSVDATGHSITQWNWSFGDGAISSQQNPSHTYLAGGIFFPSLTAVNDTSATVVGSGPPIVLPTVQIAGNPANGSPPMTVQFNAVGVDSLGLPVAGWTWSFGDGSVASQQNPSHTYNDVGIFAPSLMATDSRGLIVTGGGLKISTLPASGLILNGGFETGSFAGWTESGNSGASIDIGPLYVHTGSYGVSLGSVGTPGYLSQTFPTTPGEFYLISLWLDSPDGETPSEFSLSWGGQTLFDGVDLPAFGWTNLQLIATARSSNTTLLLGSQDDPSYLGLDDVSVRPLRPVIAGISISGHDLQVRASNGLAGYTYHVLMSPNPALPFNQWTAIGAQTISADGDFSFTLFNTVNPSAPRQFYLLQMPLP